MPDVPQTYENHTRWHAPFHFFVAPVLLTNVVVALVQLVRDPGLDRGWWLVVSAALVVLAGLARISPLRAQDRVIRLEESLRYYCLGDGCGEVSEWRRSFNFYGSTSAEV